MKLNETKINELKLVEMYGSRQSFLKNIIGLKGTSSDVSECLINLSYRWCDKYKVWFSRDSDFTETEHELFYTLTA